MNVRRVLRPAKRLADAAKATAAMAALLAGCGSSEHRSAATTAAIGQPAILSAARTTPTAAAVSRPGSVPESEGPAAIALAPEKIGTSVRGRRIVGRVVGDPNAKRHLLIVGCVHGDETAGIAITKRLRAVTRPPGVALWLVDEFNPDGCAAHTRLNANGVDLNRNSPQDWSAKTGDFYPGQHPLSEPESQAINRLVLRVRPAIIW